jgi:hypothetical protein
MCQMFRTDELIDFINRSEHYPNACQRIVEYMIGGKLDGEIEKEIRELCEEHIKKQKPFLDHVNIDYAEYKFGNRETGLEPQQGTFVKFLKTKKGVPYYHEIIPIKRCGIGTAIFEKSVNRS